MSPTTSAATRTDQLQRLEDEFGLLVRRVRRVLWERARTIHPDLQPATYLLMAHLAGHGPLRATAIVEAMGIDKGAISRQLHHLEELGLVRREPDPTDGRATLVSVTAEAVRRLREVRDNARGRLERVLADWDDADLAAFVDGLARYNRATAD